MTVLETSSHAPWQLGGNKLSASSGQDQMVALGMRQLVLRPLVKDVKKNLSGRERMGALGTSTQAPRQLVRDNLSVQVGATERFGVRLRVLRPLVIDVKKPSSGRERMPVLGTSPHGRGRLEKKRIRASTWRDKMVTLGVRRCVLRPLINNSNKPSSVRERMRVVGMSPQMLESSLSEET